jgi:hypothetical protein
VDSGDSAAWAAAIVAIVAAVISAVTAVIARLQAKSAREQADQAKRSADISEKALVESQAQTEAARQAAHAAEVQATEARRQNEIAEKQLELARVQVEGDEQRQRKEHAQRHTTNVHAVLLAAREVRAEHARNAADVIEFQEREPAPYGLEPVLFLTGHAERAWDEAVTAVRRDRPDAPAVTEAIHHYDQAAKDLSAAVDTAFDHAQNRRLSATRKQELLTKADVLGERFAQLTAACTAFFSDLGIDPTKPLDD